MPNTTCIYENAQLSVTYLFGRPVSFIAKLAAGRDELKQAYDDGLITLEDAKRSPFASDAV